MKIRLNESDYRCGLTEEKDIFDYLSVGDLISEDLIIYIRNHMPLETDKPNYLQLSKIEGYYYDIAMALKPVHHTFSAYGGQWRYHGVCYKWETINRS